MAVSREGGCGCGAIRYRIDAEPVALLLCHCTECQKQSGSAFGMSLIVKRESFTVLGQTSVYARTADSGQRVDCHFCGTCGVRIYHALEAMPATYNVKPGTLDQRDWLAPQVQVWTKSRQAWLMPPAGIPEIEGQP